MPAVTSAFSDLLSTRFQTYLVNVGKEYPRLWPRWIKSVDMETNPYISSKISGMGQQPYKPEGQQPFEYVRFWIWQSVATKATGAETHIQGIRTKAGRRISANRAKSSRKGAQS